MLGMPTPEKTSLAEIVRVARDILEVRSLTGLTMQAVAEQVGVRSPSLYKRVEGRDGLIRLVAEATLTELTERLRAATSLEDLAGRFRAFGHECPAAFQLVATPGPGVPVARHEFGAAASEPVLRWTGSIAGEAQALEAARTFTAWGVGFVSMELNHGFNLGGDVDQAWEFGVSAILAGIGSHHPRL